MNATDITRLEQLDKRYSSVNMTGFRIINQFTDKETVLKHIETDLEILSSTEVENKKIERIIFEKDAIDVCTFDNGTIISYFFTQDAGFAPMDIAKEIEMLCKTYKVPSKTYYEVLK